MSGGIKRNAYICKCDCGKTVVRPVGSLHNNATCGSGIHQQKYNRPSGMDEKSFHKILNTWHLIRSRCEKETDKDYHNYGGRGITLYKEWHDVNKFVEWYWEQSHHNIMPSTMQSVDRINVNKGYSPSNCRLVDVVAQSNNRRSNRFVEVNNERLTFTEVARKYHLTKDTVRYRYMQGKRGAELIEPLHVGYTFYVNGEMLKTKELAQKYNIPLGHLSYMLRLYKDDPDKTNKIIQTLKKEHYIRNGSK